MTIEHISDTARWVAYYRAMESERPDALFHDPYARRLAGDKGAEIVREMRNGQIAPALIVRTAVLDEIILDRVNHHGVDAVLNIAAGLDARPWRLALPAALHWIDVDLPGILDYKASMLQGEPTRCHYQAIATDVTNPVVRDALFARLGAQFQRVLVVTEGLLIYLESAQVLELARALHEQPSFRWWLFDLVTPRLLRIIERSHGDRLRKTPFRFAPAEGTAFFAPAGWRELEFRSSMMEARRLHREMRMAWFWRLMMIPMPAHRVEEIRRMSGNVLLERV